MSTLNQLKKKAKELPNDADLGAWLREYLLKDNTCCDKIENREIRYKNEMTVEVYCLKCGKLVC